MTVFFVSSRRRHTRCLSDWSSDVCSSDLNAIMVANHLAQLLVKTANPPKTVISSHHTLFFNVLGNEFGGKAKKFFLGRRSEERRVGKERRARWDPLATRQHRRNVRPATSN